MIEGKIFICSICANEVVDEGAAGRCSRANFAESGAVAAGLGFSCGAQDVRIVPALSSDKAGGTAVS